MDGLRAGRGSIVGLALLVLNGCAGYRPDVSAGAGLAYPTSARMAAARAASAPTADGQPLDPFLANPGTIANSKAASHSPRVVGSGGGEGGSVWPEPAAASVSGSTGGRLSRWIAGLGRGRGKSLSGPAPGNGVYPVGTPHGRAGVPYPSEAPAGWADDSSITSPSLTATSRDDRLARTRSSAPVDPPQPTPTVLPVAMNVQVTPVPEEPPVAEAAPVAVAVVEPASAFEGATELRPEPAPALAAAPAAVAAVAPVAVSAPVAAVAPVPQVVEAQQVEVAAVGSGRFVPALEAPGAPAVRHPSAKLRGSSRLGFSARAVPRSDGMVAAAQSVSPMLQPRAPRNGTNGGVEMGGEPPRSEEMMAAAKRSSPAVALRSETTAEEGPEPSLMPMANRVAAMTAIEEAAPDSAAPAAATAIEPGPGASLSTPLPGEPSPLAMMAPIEKARTEVVAVAPGSIALATPEAELLEIPPTEALAETGALVEAEPVSDESTTVLAPGADLPALTTTGEAGAFEEIAEAETEVVEKEAEAPAPVLVPESAAATLAEAAATAPVEVVETGAVDVEAAAERAATILADLDTRPIESCWVEGPDGPIILARAVVETAEGGLLAAVRPDQVATGERPASPSRREPVPVGVAWASRVDHKPTFWSRLGFWNWKRPRWVDRPEDGVEVAAGADHRGAGRAGELVARGSVARATTDHRGLPPVEYPPSYYEAMARRPVAATTAGSGSSIVGSGGPAVSGWAGDTPVPGQEAARLGTAGVVTPSLSWRERWSHRMQRLLGRDEAHPGEGGVPHSQRAGSAEPHPAVAMAGSAELAGMHYCQKCQRSHRADPALQRTSGDARRATAEGHTPPPPGPVVSETPTREAPAAVMTGRPAGNEPRRPEVPAWVLARRQGQESASSRRQNPGGGQATVAPAGAGATAPVTPTPTPTEAEAARVSAAVDLSTLPPPIAPSAFMPR